MTPEILTPSKAAYRLTKVVNAFAAAHGLDRFPVAVPELAREAASIFHWDDPITQVHAANIPRFEGALYPGDDRREWYLLFNDRLTSPGRIRFTQAHELGHYLLHRRGRASFECTEQDMLDWSDDEKNIEAQADLFASTLLMPLDDFRQQVNAKVDFDLLGACADRYGTSLTATTLKWLDFTEENAVLVVSRDGFMRWSHASKAAMRAGAFFRTRGRPVEVPPGALASDNQVAVDRAGRTIDARTWFAHAEAGASLRELKITADQYDSVMSLLILPRHLRVWPPWESDTD